MLRIHFSKWSLLIFLVVLVGTVYWPGVHGDYLLDDGSNILFNPRIAMKQLDWYSIKQAWNSTDAGPLGRPIAMLTFAINYYLTGFDPFYFKLTNIVIHCINVVLVYFLSSELLKAVKPINLAESSRVHYIYPLLCAAIWGLHPFNLTSVLYIVQRMTSLAATFSILSMYCFFVARSRLASAEFSNRLISIGLLFFCSVLFFVASVFTKENSLVVAPILVWAEICIFRFVVCGQCSVLLKKVIIICSLMGVGVLCFYFYSRFDNINSSYLVRNFSMEERLLTQTRVVWFYIKQTLIPVIASMGLNHDDIVVSSNWFNPISTIFSFFGLLAIIGIIVALIRYQSTKILVFSLGFFLLGHSLEAGPFPLEMVYEHRNYFPAIAIAWLIAMPILYFEGSRRKLCLYFLFAILMYFAFSTMVRSYDWRDLKSQAVTEVRNNPQSSRANFQLARVYSKLYEATKQKEYAIQASYFYQLSTELDKEESGGLVAEIQLDSMVNDQVSDELIKKLTLRLSSNAMVPANIAFLTNLALCTQRGFCKLNSDQLLHIFNSAYANKLIPKESAALLDGALAQYFSTRGNDYARAAIYVESAYKNNPTAVNALNAAAFYSVVGDRTKFDKYLKILKGLNDNGTVQKEITALESLKWP